MRRAEAYAHHREACKWKYFTEIQKSTELHKRNEGRWGDSSWHTLPETRMSTSYMISLVNASLKIFLVQIEIKFGSKYHTDMLRLICFSRGD